MIAADLTQTWSRMSIVSLSIQKIFKETFQIQSLILPVHQRDCHEIILRRLT